MNASFHASSASLTLLAASASAAFPFHLFSRVSPPPPFRRSAAFPRASVNDHTVLNSSNNGTVSSITADTVDLEEIEVAKGYTMTQFCDKIIEVFLNEKPRSRDRKKVLVFRDQWKKYKDSFYKRCQVRADKEDDHAMKQKLLGLAKTVEKIDNEMEQHAKLLVELQENPTDINAVVARRRKDFTEEFFHFLKIRAEVSVSLDERDAMTRLGAKCLSAVRAYDNAIEDLDKVEAAQSKFDEILKSPSLEVACEKIKSMAKAKELDSSLILLIYRSWAVAKENQNMSSAVKNIMYHIYKATKSSVKSFAPKEIKLLKRLLNISDPEERFSALATAFCPGSEHEVKDDDALFSTPEELHKWIKIMLDAYQLNKEEADIREARNMEDPVVIQRLFILMETIEEEYMKKQHRTSEDSEEASEE